VQRTHTCASLLQQHYIIASRRHHGRLARIAFRRLLPASATCHLRTVTMSAARSTQPRLRPEQVIAEPTTSVEQAKRLAARRAVDEYVRDGMAVGVGSGSTIVYAIQRLAERARDPDAPLHITCVPTSFQSRQVGARATARGSAACCARERRGW
jgi:hypothetical protein